MVFSLLQAPHVVSSLVPMVAAPLPLRSVMEHYTVGMAQMKRTVASIDRNSTHLMLTNPNQALPLAA